MSSYISSRKLISSMQIVKKVIFYSFDHLFRVLDRPARGSGRPFSEVGPLLNLAHGSKRVDPKRKKVKRITNLSIRGAPYP